MIRDVPPDPHPDLPGSAPLVSVVMANHDGAAFIEAAMRSVLAQTHANLELIVSDDRSDDASVALARGAAAADARVRVIEADRNGGPSRARNAALAVARGEWVAIVDSDDLMHPERLERLLAAAVRHGADMVADDMVPFGAGLAGPHGTMFGRRLAGGPVRITAADLLGRGALGLGAAELGYLKPLISRAALGARHYDETMRNGEDFDFYLRLLLGGARFVLMPDPTYLYRRHPGSISHRLTEAMLAPLLAAHDALPVPADPAAADAMAARRATLLRALRYARLVDAVKARAAWRAGGLVLRHPALLADLAQSLRDRRRRGAPAPTLGAARVILAAPDDPRAAREEGETIHFAPDPGPDGHAADALGAARLCAIWGVGSPDVVAIGPMGLRGLGYLPGWRGLELRLTRGEARALAGRTPADAGLRPAGKDQSEGGSSSR